MNKLALLTGIVLDFAQYFQISFVHPQGEFERQFRCQNHSNSAQMSGLRFALIIYSIYLYLLSIFLFILMSMYTLMNTVQISTLFALFIVLLVGSTII